MKVVFYSLMHILLATSRADTMDISEIIDLGAVTNFPGIEKYYRDLRKDTQITDEPPPEPSNMTRREKIKKRICENIFTSHHFRMKSQEWINVEDAAVRLELQNNYPHFFRILFVESEIPLEDEYRYENEYTLRTVWYKNEYVEEFGFSCLALDRPGHQLREYFISRAYNVNIVTDASPIAGRFVFTPDDRDQLVLESMAEESALEWAFLRWTNLNGFVYAYSRIWDELAEDPREDSVCRLSDGFKLRLCASLYASRPFKNHLTFIPTIDNVQRRCQIREAALSKFHWGVYLRLEMIMFPLLELDRYIAEWVIGCKARTRTGQPITHFVSRGDSKNTIFVYNTARFTRRRDRIAPWNLFYNVSVVDKGMEDLPELTDLAENLVEYALDIALS